MQPGDVARADSSELPAGCLDAEGAADEPMSGGKERRCIALQAMVSAARSAQESRALSWCKHVRCEEANWLVGTLRVLAGHFGRVPPD